MTCARLVIAATEQFRESPQTGLLSRSCLLNRPSNDSDQQAAPHRVCGLWLVVATLFRFLTYLRPGLISPVGLGLVLWLLHV